MSNKINFIHEINNIKPSTNFELQKLGYGALVINEGGARTFQATLCEAFSIIDDNLRALINKENTLESSITDYVGSFTNQPVKILS